MGLLLAAFLLGGIAGRRHLLPELREPDTSLLPQSLALAAGELAGPQAWAKYPHLVSRAAAPSLAPPAVPGPGDLEHHLARASENIVRLRLVVLALSSLIVPATCLLARVFLTRGAALVATWFVATSLLVNSYALARPHVPAAALDVLAVVACVAYARRGGLLRAGLAGLGCGVAMGALHSGAFTLISLAAAHLWRSRRDRDDGRSAQARHLPGLVALAAIAVCTRAFYPFLFSPVLAAPPVLEIWRKRASRHRRRGLRGPTCRTRT